MSRTREAPQAQAGPEDARLSKDRDLAGPEIDPTEDRGRRWYHLRPKPRRRTDLWGLNSAWWMALGWPLLIVLAISPWPWW
jgi:hypothetical protein